MLHLIHPAIVHVSVAFLVVGGLVEVGGVLARRESPTRFGGWLVGIGTASLVVTVVTGYLAANTVAVPDEARGLLGAHERNGWILLGLFLLALFWKAWHRGEVGSGRTIYVLVLLAGIVLTAYSAFLGGKLVYRHGVGVGDSGALEHRLQGVSGDLRILAQPADRVGVPVLAERHVDAEPVAVADEDPA